MLQELITNIVAGIILLWLGWIARAFYNRGKYSTFRFVRKFKIFHSGAQGYYYSFPPEDNKKVWERVNDSFYYLGISTDTINNELMDFMKSEKGKKLKYKFLLMNPENEGLLKEQELFKNGYEKESSLDDTTKSKIIQKVKNTKESILLNVKRIKNTERFGAGQVEIKYFDEFLPWWVYVFDNNKIFIGLLEFGKSGLESPLVILEKNKIYFTLYDAFVNNWNRIWKNAKPLEIISKNTL